jgi:hypothetical protein
VLLLLLFGGLFGGVFAFMHYFVVESTSVKMEGGGKAGRERNL